MNDLSFPIGSKVIEKRSGKVVTYLGRREVKDVDFDFFEEDGVDGCFFEYPSKVKDEYESIKH